MHKNDFVEEHKKDMRVYFPELPDDILTEVTELWLYDSVLEMGAFSERIRFGMDIQKRLTEKT